MRSVRAHGWIALTLVACGPRPVVGGSGDGSAGSGGTADTSIGSATSQDGTASQGSDETAAVADGWCLRGTSQPALESLEYIISVRDSDGNGLGEVWVRRPQGDPVQSTRVLAFELGDDEQLMPIIDLELAGDVWRMVDVDGDGLRDLVLRDGVFSPTGWLAGQPGNGFDDVLQPMSVSFGTDVWHDLDADGRVDLVEIVEGPPAKIVLHLGDGAGGFTPADELPYDGTLSHAEVWPTGLPGRWLVAFTELTIGFGTDDVTVVSMEVSPSGAITTLAQSDPLDITIRHVSDIDGDGIPDALGFDGKLGRGPIHLHQSVPGQYVEENLDEPILDMLAAPLTGEEVDVLQWADGEVFLRPRMDDGWPAAVPVTVDGPWSESNSVRLLDADGDGTLEILLRGSEGGYSLWWLEPCA